MYRIRLRPFPTFKLLISLWIFYTIFYIINICYRRHFEKIFINNTIEINKTRSAKLFFGIITIEKETKKRNAMYSYWIQDAVKLGHDYVYCTKSRIDSKFKWTPLKEWTDKEAKQQQLNETQKQNRDRENKRITMAEYFLKKTNADFYICPTDDVIVDIPRINEFTSILQRKYDTFKDLVMLGSCQTKNRYNVSFFQGGTGYIMTRRMAKEFVKHAYKWVRESLGPDDFEITRFLGYIGQTPSNGTIPYMCGHGLFDLRFKKIRYKKFKKCPQIYDPFCQQGVHKLEDIYIFHPHVNFRLAFRIWNNFQTLIKDKNHRYGYYNVFPTTHVCILE